MIDTFARADPRYSAVTKLTTGLQAVISVTIFAVAVVKAVADFDSLRTVDTIRQVLLAPVLSMLFAPFIYFVLLYAKYELLFIRLEMASEMDHSVKRYAKWCLIRHVGVNVQKVDTFVRAHAMELRRIKSREEVDKLMGPLPRRTQERKPKQPKAFQKP